MKGAALSLALLGLARLAQAESSTECSLLGTVVSSKQLTWCPCEGEFFCARLDVPLDYQNRWLGRASIPLLKVPAAENSKKGPYQGMILKNPGGPGMSGVDDVRQYGKLYQGLWGDNWDIVGFDPRGMWLSEPLADCWTSTADHQSTSLNSRSVPRIPDDYYDSFIRFGINLGWNCANLAGWMLDAGPYMSTATNARDILSIVDAFAATEDGQRAAKPGHLLNYLGTSYGTFLGQTFASMFPNRVGSMVLDAVVDPESYLTNMTHNSMNHIDGAIALFFIYCHEVGPSKCSYYTGSSAKDIFQRFKRLYVQLDAKKAREHNWSNATDIESALLNLKTGIQGSAYMALGRFRRLAETLRDLEIAIQRQELNKWNKRQLAAVGDPSPAGLPVPQFALGTMCSDQGNRWYNKTLEDFRPLLAELEEQSIIGDIWIKLQLACSGWSIEAAETFTGPFGGNTANPILFVGNTYDPVTPVENALSSAQKYKGAQALVLDAVGHGSFSTQNRCGFNKIAKYFNDGEMPGDDSFCPFVGNISWGISLDGTLEENIKQAGLTNLLGLI